MASKTTMEHELVSSLFGNIERADEGPEPDLQALAQALTWEGYGLLDAEGRREMIGQLWTLYDRRKAESSGCQASPTGE